MTLSGESGGSMSAIMLYVYMWAMAGNQKPAKIIKKTCTTRPKPIQPNGK